MANQQAKEAAAQRMKETTANDSTLDQFTGPADQTPLYRSLVQTGRQSTSRAYDSAKSAVRANAHAAGYGYEQPVTGAADAGMERSEASDLSAIPRTALNDVTNTELQAANVRNGEISAFNPAPLTSTAVSAETQRRSALMQALTGVGKLGASFIPIPKGASGTV